MSNSSVPTAPLTSAELLEAVFLYQDGQISRELLYPEFEAILDGFIPFPDFANATAKAAYLQIDSGLRVRGIVFFLISFDGTGMVDRRWNVPLRQLIDATATGPDMGAGPIKLACLSQCPIAWQQKNLWDPVMERGNNSFVAIRKVVKKNRLGLIFRSKTGRADKDSSRKSPDAQGQAELQQKLHDHYGQELRNKTAALQKEQRLRIATLMNQHQAALHGMQHQHQQRIAAYQTRLHELEQQNADLVARNYSLKGALDTQAQKIEGMREYFAHKLKAAESGESTQIQMLQENFALEMDAKIKAATADLREMLDMREVELFYRHQNETVLKEEIVTLKREHQQLLKNSGDQLLERLTKAGINLVTYLPGVGETAIPLDDLATYLDDPHAYAAEKAEVSEAVYFAWLEHHLLPQCNAVDSKGHQCGRSIPVVGSPLEFHPGESDRCAEHQAVVFPRVAKSR